MTACSYPPYTSTTNAHYTQHLPGSFEHALASSRAHHIEARSVHMATHGVQCAVSYYLQRQRLEQLWTSIQQSIATDPERFDVLREPQLFLLVKNTKLLFKTTPSPPTIIDAMENFASYRDRNLDMAHSDPSRFSVDIAREVCPRASLLARQRAHVGEEAQVYSWEAVLPRELRQLDV